MATYELPEWAEQKWGHILDAAGLFGGWRVRASYLLEMADKYGVDSPELVTIRGRFAHDETIIQKLSEVGNGNQED